MSSKRTHQVQQTPLLNDFDISLSPKRAKPAEQLARQEPPLQEHGVYGGQAAFLPEDGGGAGGAALPVALSRSDVAGSAAATIRALESDSLPDSVCLLT